MFGSGGSRYSRAPADSRASARYGGRYSAGRSEVASPPISTSASRAGLRLCRNAVVASTRDRKSTRLNSSHVAISYAVFCLKKKKEGDDIDIAHMRNKRGAGTATVQMRMDHEIA